MALNDGPPFGPVVNGTMVVVFWEYRPSNVAAYALLALFALATLGHLIYFFWLKAWTFIPFLLGGICEVFGYLERARAHTSPTELGPWILQNMLLLVAPPLLAASVYMSLGRVSSALLQGVHAARRARRDRRRAHGCCYNCCCAWSPTRLYVLADIAAIFTQLIGTVLPASGTEEGQRLSVIIVLAGLLVQLIALGIFLVVCVKLHVRLRRDPVELSRPMTMDPGVNWLWYLAVLEVAAVMMVVRSIVRGVEYIGGTDGFVASHEAFIYVFDAAPMFIVMAGFLLLHPARLVREVERLEDKIPAAGEFTELTGPYRVSRSILEA